MNGHFRLSPRRQREDSLIWWLAIGSLVMGIVLVLLQVEMRVA